MKSPEDTVPAKDASPEPAGKDDSETTGLPFLHTWRGVYLFVLGSFILWVLLLVALGVLFR